MLGTVELSIHRANTAIYIALNPTNIVLTPIQEQWVAGSKKLVPQTPRTLQTFHVIWAPETGIVGGGGSGITHKFDFILVGPWDAVVAINDRWDYGTQRNVIDYIFPSNGYELKCGGTSYGSKPNA
jgi:hypothetical protein